MYSTLMTASDAAFQLVAEIRQDPSEAFRGRRPVPPVQVVQFHGRRPSVNNRRFHALKEVQQERDDVLWIKVIMRPMVSIESDRKGFFFKFVHALSSRSRSRSVYFYRCRPFGYARVIIERITGRCRLCSSYPASAQNGSLFVSGAPCKAFQT